MEQGERGGGERRWRRLRGRREEVEMDEDEDEEKERRAKEERRREEVDRGVKRRNTNTHTHTHTQTHAHHLLWSLDLCLHLPSTYKLSMRHLPSARPLWPRTSTGASIGGSSNHPSNCHFRKEITDP